MRYLATLALMLLAASAYGQIVAPAEVEQGKLLVATISVEIPEGAQVKGPGWIVPEGLDFLEVAPGKIAATGLPGTYTLRYERSWLHIVPVTFTDGSGQPVTIQSFLGMGDYKETATVTVKGKDGPPNPPPPPPSDQKWQIVIVHQAGEKLSSLPQGQRDLITSRVVREELASMGHVVQGIRDDSVLSGADSKLAPFVDAIKASGVALPAIAISPVNKSEVPKAFPLPANWQALTQLLGGKQ